jgi:hypothetical protein
LKAKAILSTVFLLPLLLAVLADPLKKLGRTGHYLSRFMLHNPKAEQKKSKFNNMSKVRV